jgi:nicotinate-nucleotide adenylyltransferase
MTSQSSSGAGSLAVMGGAFDPVHYGHLRTAVELIERLEFDELRFIPSANPPHRDPHIAAATDRVRMLQAAIQGLPRCTIDDREISYKTD